MCIPVDFLLVVKFKGSLDLNHQSVGNVVDHERQVQKGDFLPP